jgi:general secretion pathway protein E
LLDRIPDAARVKLRGVNAMDAASGHGLRELWEKSDLPSGIFADEVAGFWRLPRLGLQDLMNAVGATEQFSPRFLRESSVFPFRAGDGGFGLAVSDPADGAAIRAAEIVCGRPVMIAVASFDDIATVLETRLDERSTGAVVDEPEHRTGDDDIDSLRPSLPRPQAACRQPMRQVPG